MNIYVGNLSRDVSEDELKEAFEAFGTVDKANVIKDKFTGESRGFGFVEMPDSEEAQKAITEINGQDLKGRALNVNEARPRPQGGAGTRGGGRPGGNGGGRSGGFGPPRNGGGGGGRSGGFGGRGRF